MVLGILCVLVSGAHADPDAKRATALFDEGQALKKEGRVADACEKFEESYELDPAIGTELNVADCREREGKVDEAWELFDHAARTDKRADRAKYARARADSISKARGKQADSDETEKEPIVEPPPDPAPEDEPREEPARPRHVQRSPESAPASADTHDSRIGWRIVFAGSVMVAGAGIGLAVYGQSEIDDAQKALCDGGGYPQGNDVCPMPPPMQTLSASEIANLNAQGDRGHNFAIAGELAAVIGVGFAAISLYEGFIASPSKSGTHVAVVPTVSPHSAGATLSLAW